MRANQPGIVSNSYLSSTAANCEDQPTACAMTPGSTTAIGTCSAAQVAAWDLWEIRCSNGVQDALPGGTMLVTSTTSTTYQIEINWKIREKHGSDNNADSDKMTVNFMPWKDPTL